MGLFSRNEPASGAGRRQASRSSLSSEAQASELRGRARRRLIGALALVLAAVIIVPMLFDSPEPPDQVSTPVVVPAITPPTPDANLALAPSAGSGTVGQTPEPASPQNPDAATGAPAAGVATPGVATPGGTTPESADQAASNPQPPAEAAAPTPAAPKPAEPAPAHKPAEKPEPKPKPKAPEGRTDDGSVALALLEGRSPPRSAAPAAKGNFILQIAAYTSEKDAEVRRGRLASAGVTNAYVENAVSGGKTTYRLRVGPFPTRDAAQAAQARLRALGYDNGFISTK